MIDNENENNMMVTIKFSLFDENNQHYAAESSVSLSNVFNDSPIDILGKQFLVFLKQAGYFVNNEYLFMRPINEDEYDVLDNYLTKYRADKKGKIE